MSTRFDLVVTANAADSSAEFRLLDGRGTQLAWKRTVFGEIAPSLREGLFDLRNYLRIYVPPGQERQAITDIGVCIAEDVLGKDIFEPLWRPTNPGRTLRILLPGAEDISNPLAAALARVPWEIARPSANEDTLADRNLLVRIAHEGQPAPQALALAPDEDLRVLLVFAEARGSSPLAMRQEREQLLSLLQQEIYPERRVVADVLSHGVTRERLHDKIQRHGGFHIVHWSGHGHLNLLELCRPGGAQDHLSGQQLVDLFVDAGGYLPRLFFLSACHSGNLQPVRDWNDFMAVAEGREPNSRAEPPTEAATRDLDLKKTPGFTGTAHALLQGGVPAVVAMRYAVGDDYARELAVAFYRSLLAHERPKSIAAALTLARRQLAADAHNAARYAECDHATPVLYGEEDPDLRPQAGQSPALDARDPRLQRIAELTIAQHAYFVGRTWELAGLGSDFIGARAGAEIRPVAVITGLGGMGKTALVAETLALWEARFQWVLLYQSKPNALAFEAFLRDLDLKLRGELGRYHARVRANPAEAIHREADDDFNGQPRVERLVDNLIRALRAESILLVLDNLETLLKPLREGETAAACQDPAWDYCLQRLSEELRRTPSRVLITSRRPLLALPAERIHAITLGPLPAAEAALYLRAHPTLSAMVFDRDIDARKLAQRIFRASRFHPLLMDRLAQLAGTPSLRPQLLQVLDTLEQGKDYARLPELFATERSASSELAYLDDALRTSLDQLLEAVGADARRLLWMIAIANEPVALGLLRSVWQGEDFDTERLRKLKQMLEQLPTLPEELQEKLRAMPEELRAQIDALLPAPSRPEIMPLLKRLIDTGLVTEKRMDGKDTNPDLSCHELVRERIHAWMRKHPVDQSEWNENTLRLGYAARLQTAFETMQHHDMTLALEAGRRALVYCVQSEDWERLGEFASGLVTSSQDPQLLEELIPHLQIAADASPEGRNRWTCFGYLADALSRCSRSDVSLPIYAKAVAMAREASRAEDSNQNKIWSDLAWLTSNWAYALRDNGNLEEARQCLIESTEAEARANAPAINILASEAEALRIDIMQARMDIAPSRIEEILAQIWTWWEKHLAGTTVPEAPNPRFLARSVIGALDIAKMADVTRGNWPSAIARVDTILEVMHVLKLPEVDIAANRMNRASLLTRIPERKKEALVELETCLQIFESDPTRSARTLGCLADLFNEQGDNDQAIALGRRSLVFFEKMPDIRDRAFGHNNLAIYISRSRNERLQAEAHLHRLAGLLYCLVAGFGQAAKTMLQNYASHFQNARAAGTVLIIPRVSDLLADPAFEALARWMREREVDPDALQIIVDRLLDEVKSVLYGQASSNASPDSLMNKHPAKGES